MRAAGEVVNGDPLMVVEVGLVIGGGGLHRIGPVQAIVIGTGDGDLLAGKLREGIGQAGVVDGDAAGEAEGAVTEPGAVVQAGVAARDPAKGVEAGQETTAPRLAIISRAVIGGSWDTRGKGARAGKRGGGARTERLLKLVIGPSDQDARQWVAGDGWFVLFVLRERQAVILIHQEVADNGRQACLVSVGPGSEHRAGQDSGSEGQDACCGQESSRGEDLDHVLRWSLECPRHGGTSYYKSTQLLNHYEASTARRGRAKGL